MPPEGSSEELMQLCVELGLPSGPDLPRDIVARRVAELAEALPRQRQEMNDARAASIWSEATRKNRKSLVAVSAAGLALYDMAKAVDRSITITDLRLLSKQGGRSGAWKRPEA